MEQVVDGHGGSVAGGAAVAVREGTALECDMVVVRMRRLVLETGNVRSCSVEKKLKVRRPELSALERRVPPKVWTPAQAQAHAKSTPRHTPTTITKHPPIRDAVHHVGCTATQSQGRVEGVLAPAVAASSEMLTSPQRRGEALSVNIAAGEGLQQVCDAPYEPIALTGAKIATGARFQPGTPRHTQDVRSPRNTTAHRRRD